MRILPFYCHSNLHEILMGKISWGASGPNAGPPHPAPKRRPAPTTLSTLMKVARSNATTDNSLPPNGCERRPQTQMASKRVCRRPATAALRRLLCLCAQNFCLVSCVVKTNQLEAIAPILLTENSFSCGLRTMHITQSVRSSVFKPSSNV